MQPDFEPTLPVLSVEEGCANDYLLTQSLHSVVHLRPPTSLTLSKMSSTTLLTLPRELRDMVVRYVIESPQPELNCDQLVYFSETFAVASARTLAPANLFWSCRQLREEALYFTKFWDRTPRLEIHIREMSTMWEICTAWSFPPSACVYSRNRKFDSMTIDLKPRNNAQHVHFTQGPDLQRNYPTSRSLWQDDLFTCSAAGDFLGYLVGRAVQRLGLNDAQEEIWSVTGSPPAKGLPQLRHVSRTRHDPSIVLRRLYLNICRDERHPDEQLPDIVTRGIRGDVLTFMYRCVSSSISCCPEAVKMVDQEDGLKQLMCYCQHRLMWYTQVGNITITEGSDLHYRINLGNMLSNDIKTTKSDPCRKYLHNLMSLRERRYLDYVHRAGIQLGFTRYRPELPAVTFF
ncbi:uncharacterized protein M421DRAFT_335988 [Didymella exigua CBS 183.55]|uniref:Uncharacterized protein n=1 Tax=Didymella exigua CBS 183.55 TaxID=1150837 RepID=A0A6A5RB13_9PLEO|nr:uncharacterized protein M421DRAFT_335988 [Didymella exigua CBS 183.55]KAF1922987.1 hypothetical protein M421DRAFT_335988 [Didymella exigua CBS 183.55]